MLVIFNNVIDIKTVWMFYISNGEDNHFVITAVQTTLKGNALNCDKHCIKLHQRFRLISEGKIYCRCG